MEIFSACLRPNKAGAILVRTLEFQNYRLLYRDHSKDVMKPAMNLVS